MVTHGNVLTDLQAFFKGAISTNTNHTQTSWLGEQPCHSVGIRQESLTGHRDEVAVLHHDRPTGIHLGQIAFPIRCADRQAEARRVLKLDKLLIDGDDVELAIITGLNHQRILGNGLRKLTVNVDRYRKVLNVGLSTRHCALNFL